VGAEGEGGSSWYVLSWFPHVVLFYVVICALFTSVRAEPDYVHVLRIHNAWQRSVAPERIILYPHTLFILLNAMADQLITQVSWVATKIRKPTLQKGRLHEDREQEHLSVIVSVRAAITTRNNDDDDDDNERDLKVSRVLIMMQAGHLA